MIIIHNVCLPFFEIPGADIPRQEINFPLCNWFGTRKQWHRVSPCKIPPLKVCNFHESARIAPEMPTRKRASTSAHSQSGWFARGTLRVESRLCRTVGKYGTAEQRRELVAFSRWNADKNAEWVGNVDENSTNTHSTVEKWLTVLRCDIKPKRRRCNHKPNQQHETVSLHWRISTADPINRPSNTLVDHLPRANGLVFVRSRENTREFSPLISDLSIHLWLLLGHIYTCFKAVCLRVNEPIWI